MFIKLFARTLILVLSIGSMLSLAHAENAPRFSITKSYNNATAIAIVPFTGANSPVTETLSGIITQDLNRSGKLSSSSNLAQVNIGSSAQIDPKLWSANSTPYILVGTVVDTNNQLTINFELVDTSNYSRKLAEQIQVPYNRLRDAGHLIADKVFEAITGVKGDFTGKIAYILTKQANGKTIYKLEVADTDGARPQTIFSSSEPLMSPTWSPDGTSLAYVSFESGMANIFIQNVYSAKREQITNFKGFSSAPAFSPDGTKLLFTSAKDGNADIYQMQLADKSVKPLITHTAIDTEGSYSPDGSSVIFTSDRGGTPQVYQFDINKRTTKRLTFEGNFNGKPIMSRDLKSVALIHNTGPNKYQMGILDISSGITHVLSTTFSDESPAFSPNGTMLSYGSSQNGKGVLAIVSRDGRFSMQLPAQDGAISESAWNPIH